MNDLIKKLAYRYMLAQDMEIDVDESDLEDEDSKDTGKKPTVNIEVVEQVVEKLKNNKYTSEKTGRSIKFTTAYNQKHKKAVEDFRKEYLDVLEGMRGDQPKKKVKPKSKSSPKKKVKPKSKSAPKKEVQEKPKSKSDLETDKIVDGDYSDLDLDNSAESKEIKEKLVKDVTFDNPPYNRDSGDYEEQRKAHKKKSFERYSKLNSDDRKEVKQSLKEAIKDNTISQEQRDAYVDSYASLVANQILSGDKDAPPSSPLFTDIVKNTKSQTLKDKSVELITNTAVATSNSEKRELRKDYFNSLSDDDFMEAIGGSDGVFGGLANKLSPNFCPATPENGDLGGKEVADGECPSPLSDEARTMLREHLTYMMMDGMVFKKTKESETGTGEGEKDKPKSINEYMDSDEGKDYMQALIDGDESRVKKHVAKMRSINAVNSLEGSDDPYLNNIKDRLVGIAESEDPNLDEMDSLFDLEQEDRPKREDYDSLEEFNNAQTNYSLNKQAKNLLTQKIASIYINNLFITDSYNDKRGITSMNNKTSTVYVDYQQRAKGFEVGMRVFPFFEGNPNKAGVVRAVYPAIGMVDVQFPHGSTRMPVEDLVVDTSGDTDNVMEKDSIPGGVGTVPVSSGASEDVIESVSKVASLYMKKALYWAERDRKYKRRKDESHAHCPKCKDVKLKNTSYKRINGLSERLLGCPSCLFLIKKSDIL